jgi:hypothetical protein
LCTEHLVDLKLIRSGEGGWGKKYSQTVMGRHPLSHAYNQGDFTFDCFLNCFCREDSRHKHCRCMRIQVRFRLYISFESRRAIVPPSRCCRREGLVQDEFLLFLAILRRRLLSHTRLYLERSMSPRVNSNSKRWGTCFPVNP